MLLAGYTLFLSYGERNLRETREEARGRRRMEIAQLSVFVVAQFFGFEMGKSRYEKTCNGILFSHYRFWNFF